MKNTAELERALIGAILLDNSVLDLVCDKISAECFDDPLSRDAYEIILEQRSSKIDGLLLLKKLSDKLGNAAAVDYVAKTSVITTSFAEAYAREISDEHQRRTLILALASAQADLEVASSRDQIELAKSKISQSLQAVERSKRAVKIGDILMQSITDLEDAYARKGKTSGLSTGYKRFDDMTDGLGGGDLVVIAARPSMGKTALATNIAVNAAMSAKTVGFYSVEMSARSIASRVLGSEARADLLGLRKGIVSESAWSRLSVAAESISKIPLYIDEIDSPTALEISSRARRLKRDVGLDLIVIDYLQLMSGRSRENRTQEVSEISRDIKRLAVSIDVPIILLSQLNRALEQRADKRPMLSDLRESGAIEQDADIVAFIYRAGYYDASDDDSLAEIIIAKQRNGPTGSFKLKFTSEYARFDDYDEPTREFQRWRDRDAD